MSLFSYPKAHQAASKPYSYAESSEDEDGFDFVKTPQTAQSDDEAAEASYCSGSQPGKEETGETKNTVEDSDESDGTNPDGPRSHSMRPGPVVDHTNSTMEEINKAMAAMMHRQADTFQQMAGSCREQANSYQSGLPHHPGPRNGCSRFRGRRGPHRGRHMQHHPGFTHHHGPPPPHHGPPPPHHHSPPPPPPPPFFGGAGHFHGYHPFMSPPWSHNPWEAAYGPAPPPPPPPAAPYSHPFASPRYCSPPPPPPPPPPMQPDGPRRYTGGPIIDLDASKDTITPRPKSPASRPESPFSPLARECDILDDAVEAPRSRGDFHKTSHSHELFQHDNKYFLRSVCFNIEGQEVTTELCLDDILENDHGEFDWVHPGGQKQGLFSHSARNIQLKIGNDQWEDSPTLEAMLDDGVGAHRFDRIDLGRLLENVDGSLEIYQTLFV
ncbi:MAG: hypothetical protein M1831_001297 [Alyxoria varia]|nr:MAG: hypothetical protein M1831_001297 [Alyxoria varia]